MLAGALAAAAAAGACWIASRPVGCFEAAVRLRLVLAGLRSRRGRAGGVDLHWYERPGEPPAVVLLHGLGADAERWFPLLPALLPRRRLLAPSLPAHGRSASPAAPFGVEDVARWMGEWLDRSVPPGGQADLIGFSMGGWIAARLALDFPRRVRRLVLLSSAGLRFDPPPPRRLLAPQSVEDARALLDVLCARPLRLPRFVLRDLLRRARPERVWLVDSALRGEGLLEGSLHKLRLPTLVAWGAQDRLLHPATLRRLAREVPGARAVEIPDCGHLPYWEKRRQVRALLEEFLA
jgi:pimeloyl-ACP methyl ester carboxylesterase